MNIYRQTLRGVDVERENDWSMRYFLLLYLAAANPISKYSLRIDMYKGGIEGPASTVKGVPLFMLM